MLSGRNLKSYIESFTRTRQQHMFLLCDYVYIDFSMDDIQIAYRCFDNDINTLDRFSLSFVFKDSLRIII